MSYEIENITKTIEIRKRNGNVPLLCSHVRDYEVLIRTDSGGYLFSVCLN